MTRIADLMRAYLQSFPSHVQLIQEGDRADFLFALSRRECAELCCLGAGHEITMTMVEPGGTFILAAVLKDAVT